VDGVADDWGNTALMSAAGGGTVEVVRLLLERGANVDQQNENGWTALMSAAFRGYADVISLLLAHGADAGLKNHEEDPALVVALENQAGVPVGETAEERIEREEGYKRSIRLLTEAQPAGEAALAEWYAAREEGERWWRRSFRRLYHAVEDYDGERLYQEILEPFVPHALESLGELQRYRKLNTPENPYEPAFEDLAQFYAMNRVSDFLLLGLQTGGHLDWDAPFQTEVYKRDVGYARLRDWQGPRVTFEEYEGFFETLGFRSVPRLAFSPFFHEIVEVIEDSSCMGGVVVEHVFWPGLLFGNMLFSRAGVRVRADPDVIRQAIAERSPILFTYWRRRREARDPSHGWGHNSQWGTEHRRDYIEGDCFHYNVDGRSYLDDSYCRRRRGDDPEEQDDLTLAERIELLTHRCFVRTEKPACDYYPYDDRYSEPVPQRVSLPLLEPQ